MGKRGKGAYPSKQTVNLAACGNAMENVEHILPVTFLCFALLAAITGFCIIWPVKEIHAAQAELEKKRTELSRYQEYNEDYRQIEEAYQEYFRTYLTQEEASLADRSKIVRLLEEKTTAYGVVKYVDIEENICQVVIEEIPLSAVSQLAVELESDPLIQQVAVSIETAGENRAGEGKTQTVTVDFMIVLAEPDTISTEGR